MNEAETRAEHIDPALKSAGWGVVEGSRIRREVIAPGRLLGNGKRDKPEIADYVLVYKNTKLAVIEAKAWGKPYNSGVTQAKAYAGKMEIRFTYSTNGQKIYAIDMRAGTEGDVAAWPTPDELWQATFAAKDAWRDRFADVPYEEKGGTWTVRYYQDIAVRRVLEALAAGQRRILLTLATGTGKTAIAFQIAWKLYQSRWNLTAEPTRRPRILFLADRNLLANQAYNAFSAFENTDPGSLVRIDPESIRKKGKVPKNGSVFFTIFQTFMCGPATGGHPTPYFGDYPKDFFDFIVIDECHRGGAQDESTWRGILEYFAPAVQLGLTATPKRRDNVDTYAYFGAPVYQYSLKSGINDGFLTPFKVKQVATTLDEYVYTPDDEVLEGQPETGKLYTESDFNRIIEIKQREAYRVGIVLKLIGPTDKTLVFCATQLHALAVRDLINQGSPSTNSNYCHRVTADEGERGEQHLRDFQDNEKTIPTVLTTSQKLSTGVDARNVRHIVLMRPVNSMIEFKQIIGRGTRLYDGKDFFTVIDFVKAHHHFQDPEWDGEPTAVVDVGDDVYPPPVGGDEGLPDGVAEGDDNQEGGANVALKVKLADGKEREIQHMISTSFWSPDGTPLSAAQFMASLFGALPEIVTDLDDLRARWSHPDTRKALLTALADRHFAGACLAELQFALDGGACDLFDVLAYVGFAAPMVTRAERADRARAELGRFPAAHRAFLEFVLAQYVAVGVGELDGEKLVPLLKLKYGAIQDALVAMGPVDGVRAGFLGVQAAIFSPPS
ncbi:MAG: EcoAI/FtnUII family type I restriction enzme subunit R [Myxococcota bacterium]